MSDSASVGQVESPTTRYNLGSLHESSNIRRPATASADGCVVALLFSNEDREIVVAKSRPKCHSMDVVIDLGCVWRFHW